MTKDSGRETRNSRSDTLPAAVIPARLAALAVVLISLAPVPLRAQWERLPLYAGHADWLIQNKYKANEIFAIVELGGLYRSRDYGETWTTVVTDIPSLGWWRIRDFDVSASGQYYAYIHGSLTKIWRSTDEGSAWFADTALSRNQTAATGDIETHPDGSILITSWANRSILCSKDDFVHADTITAYPEDWGVTEAFFHPTNSSIHFRASGDVSRAWLLRTSDSGRSWSDYVFPAMCSPFALKQARAEQPGCLGFWTGGGTPDGLTRFEYYESTDDGINWTHTDKASVLTEYDVYRDYVEAWYDVQGISLLSTVHTLYRSADSNRTVDSMRLSIWDFLPVREHLLASTNFDGLMISTDVGRTWELKPASRVFAGFSRIEFAAANPDTLYALVGDKSDWGEMDTVASKKNYGVFASYDGGGSWREVVRDRLLANLRASPSQPGAAFYAVRNERTLIRGNAATGRIDTLFATQGRILQFERAEEFPGDLYLVEYIDRANDYDLIYVLCSTDGGATWMRFFRVPAYAEDARVYPSRTERGKAFVSCESDDDFAMQFMGIYAVREYGKSSSFTYHYPYPLELLLFGDDTFFRPHYRTFSTDEGRTWIWIDDGLSASDIATLNSFVQWAFVADGNSVYLVSEGIWIKFMNGRWHTVRHASGRPIIRTKPLTLREVGDYLYSGHPFDGLYRIRIKNPTGIGRESSMAGALSLQPYPNPFQESVALRVVMNEAGTNQATLIIRNTLGQILYTRDISGGDNTIVWKCVDRAGHPLPAGVYIASIVQKGKTLIHTILVHTH